MAELRVTQLDVAARAAISLTTLRELQNNINPRRRRPQTLSALSAALDWPTDYLSQVLRGAEASADPDEGLRSVLDGQLRRLANRVEALEHRFDTSNTETELRDLREQVKAAVEDNADLRAVIMNLYGRMGQPYPHESKGAPRREQAD
jgi:hypothetical protein